MMQAKENLMPESSIQFGGTERLYGKAASLKLRQSRVAIIGIGGVGSWTAEALARIGVGQLILVDMDEICSSNLNRQVHATEGSVGIPKTEAMRKRIGSISSATQVEEGFYFFNEKNADTFFSTAPDVVIDCIDSIPHKCLLISQCKQRGVPVVTVGGAGGRRDPSQIQRVDLSRTHGDALLHRVRKKLRQKFDFPRNTKKKWGIPAVFSAELVHYPQSDGSVCAQREADSNLRLDCESGYGTAGFVTGTFGFMAAASAVDVLVMDL
ncbi:tRNA threonylcarbamoyladenosine dehydratase [Kiritimatiellota bacterium B12222]|nr:tRNA threonylcarbamoyladenosine dehydratase [Kiritimatiellota bacterium B12222]